MIKTLEALRAEMALLPKLKDGIQRSFGGVAITTAEARTIIAALEAASTDGEFVRGLKAAAKAASEACWKHIGEDAYSQGMDAGAIHQTKACVEAIRALSPAPACKGPTEAGQP